MRGRTGNGRLEGDRHLSACDRVKHRREDLVAIAQQCYLVATDELGAKQDNELTRELRVLQCIEAFDVTRYLLLATTHVDHQKYAGKCGRNGAGNQQLPGMTLEPIHPHHCHLTPQEMSGLTGAVAQFPVIFYKPAVLVVYLFPISGP